MLKSNGGHATAARSEGNRSTRVISGLERGNHRGQAILGSSPTSKNLVTLDMGGTSCDVGLVRDGELFHVTNYEVEWGMPISAPFVDVSSIGAGGGSIARVDKGGFSSGGPTERRRRSRTSLLTAREALKLPLLTRIWCWAG